MEDNLKRLASPMRAFKREMYGKINLYKELLNIIEEQNTADIGAFLSKVPDMTQEDIARDASVLAGEVKGRNYLFDLIKNVNEV